MTATEFDFFAPPSGARRTLSVRPRLESWDHAGHPSQLALGEFLDHVDDVSSDACRESPPPWTVFLGIGLSDTTPLTTGGHDLDNYVFPIARRLGHSKINAMYAEKSRGTSVFALGAAEAAAPPPDWSFVSARSSASATTKQWKEEIAAGIAGAVSEPAEPGPLELHVSFGASDQRNWCTLWKPAIDSMGSILGADPRRPFAPFDDRVVRLGLHRTIDNRLGWDVRLGIWWRSASQEDR